jgi:WXG100 family type VII secretion target
MGRIKVDADMLRDYVGTLNGRISEYEALTARMEALNENIQASWEGSAKINFANKMAGYIQQAKQLQQILVQFRGYAQEAADKFDNLDAECAQRIRGSF